MFNPKGLFDSRVGHPVAGWLATGGFELLVRMSAYVVILALFIAIIGISIDLLFGSGIFEQDTGCHGQDPYNPCPDEHNIYSEDESFRSE